MQEIQTQKRSAGQGVSVGGEAEFVHQIKDSSHLQSET